MSVWGALPAENDDAADWLGEFVEEPTIVALNDAFDGVLSSDSDDYLEITECAVAVIAAAVVIELYASQMREAILEPDEFEALKLLENKLTPGARRNLVKRAMKCLRVVLLETDRSELAEVMQEDVALHATWKASLDGMIQILLQTYQNLGGK